MSEQQNQAHEIEQTSEQQSLKELIKELNLPDEEYKNHSMNPY